MNLGSWAEISGIVAAAREGLADQMKMHAEKIIKIDPLYADGGGYLMLGVVHFKTPYIPFFLSWPSNDEAIKWLRLSVGTGSATFSQNIYYAQSMLKDDKEEEAIDLLNKIIQESSSSNLSVEDWDQVKKAKNTKFELVEKYLDELKKDGFCDYIQPSGGYFISYESSNSNAEQIIEHCSKLGLKLLPIGSCFPYQKDPKNSNIRIAPTFPNLENLERCMEIFSKVVKKLN